MRRVFQVKRRRGLMLIARHEFTCECGTLCSVHYEQVGIIGGGQEVLHCPKGGSFVPGEAIALLVNFRGKWQELRRYRSRASIHANPTQQIPQTQSDSEYT